MFMLMLLSEYSFILADIKTVEDTMENFLEYVGRGKSIKLLYWREVPVNLVLLLICE